MYTTKSTAVVLALLLAGTVQAAEESATMAAFAFGRGRDAARVSVDVQRALRERIPTTGRYQPADIQAVLAPDSGEARRVALEDAGRLLGEGKLAYEQLDLEQAQAKFRLALKKYEYGYGYLERSAPLVECLMYLGATQVLVGEPEKAERLFLRAHDLPGRKVLDPNLFPPNIQEIFQQASRRTETAPRGKVRLLTSPQQAEVVVDDIYRGASPLEVDGLRADVHLVRALKDGFRAWGGRIRASTDRRRTFKMKLKPLPGQKGFSERHSRMASELIMGEPGEATVELATFLRAGHMALVVLEGPPDAMTLRGYLCDVNNLKLAEHQEVLDTTAPDFGQKLTDYCSKLLTASPASGQTQPAEGYAEGEAAAAALLAQAEAGPGQQEDTGLGLDLGTAGESGEEPAGASDTGEDTGEIDSGTGDTQVATGDVQAEEQRERALDESIKEAGTPRPTGDGDDESTWGYLSGRWWFWTAVGVVAAGAATGTYFLVSSADDTGGGRLTIDLY